MYPRMNSQEQLFNLCHTRNFRGARNFAMTYDYSLQIFAAAFLDSYRSEHDIKPALPTHILLPQTMLIDFLQIYNVNKSMNTGEYQQNGPLKSKDYYAACQHAMNYGRKFNDYRPICILEEFIDENKAGFAELFNEDQMTVTSNLALITELLHLKVNDETLSQLHEEFTIHFNKLDELLNEKYNEPIDASTSPGSIFSCGFMNDQMQDIKSGKDTQRTGLKYLVRLSHDEPDLTSLAKEARICYEILHQAGIDDFRANQSAALTAALEEHRAQFHLVCST